MKVLRHYFIAGIILGFLILPFILKTDNAYYAGSSAITDNEAVTNPTITQPRTQDLTQVPVQISIQDPTQIPSLVPTQTQTVTLPERLIIEKLGINAPVEYVGVDIDGAMGTPQNFDNVAWYKDGTIPGEIGNAVIAGHFDKVTGAPAVFYRLSKLMVGDQITVKSGNNKINTFIVKAKEVYPYNKVPMEQIFGPTDKKMLNLITCQGIFNQKTRNYSERTVIYSEFVE